MIKMVNIKGNLVKYILYSALAGAAIICGWFILMVPGQRLLAISVLVTIIIGGFVNMWKIFHSSDKLDNVSNNLGDVSTNLNSVSSKLADLSNAFDDLIDLKEKDIAQTKDIEEQRRKDKERYITEPLEEEFEKFLLYWKENKELIFEKKYKKMVFGDILFKRKLPWMEIESIGKESKNVIEGNKNVLRESIEHEAIEIADAIVELSKSIRQLENLRLSNEYYIERKKGVFDEGDEIAKAIEAFIEKI
jgi:hypothetical protein